MNKPLITNILRYSIVIVCLLFLTYRLFVADSFDIEGVIAVFDTMPSNRYWLAVLAIVLLPISIFVESLKWRSAIQYIHKISVLESVVSVLWGYTGAFITPNSLGEFPTRAIYLPYGSRTEAVTMGFLGSLIQTIVVTVCGLVGLGFWIGDIDMGLSHKTQIILYLSIVVILLIGILVLLKIKVFSKFIHLIRWNIAQKISSVLMLTTRKQIIRLFLLSLLKYFIFSCQFFLILILCGVEIPIGSTFIDMSVFYLLFTYIPIMNFFDVAVRSSIAIIVFGKYTESSLSIVLASSVIWILNFCLPSFVGVCFGIKNRR